MVQERRWIMSTVIISVKNMNCDGCVKRISSAVESIVEQCVVKLENKTVQFEGNADTRAKIVAKLESIGYEVV